MNYKKRTHNCGELNESNVGDYVTLNGWVSGKRNLGGILFLDLRDRYGITQLKISPEYVNIFDIASKCGLEFVVSASGKVISRESINKNIPTGKIEIDVTDFQIINESEITPFVIEENVKASEDLRLQYRYLDLRRKKMMDNLLIRNSVYHIVHNYFQKKGFTEVETPILMKSTPEGARDYLVPSRIHKGKFYALPQSPQTYKQILMVAGLDKYVQICKCFRDEDLRADRQPEFTQIDVEMSFVDQKDIFELSENLFRDIWKNIKGQDIKIPFETLTYDECMNLYGTDKPDSRINELMKIINVTEIFKNAGLPFFKDVLQNNGFIGCFIIGNKEKSLGKEVSISRKYIDKYNDYAKKSGYGGIIYAKINERNEFQSSISKYLNDDIVNLIKKTLGLRIGDNIFILAGEKNPVLKTLGNLRVIIAEDFNLINEDTDGFLWVTDFPLFKYDEESNSFSGEHHVFTSAKDEYIKFLDSTDRKDIESIRANCYDLVLNGNEIGSGSIRIHNSDIQKKVFRIIGLSDQEADEKFGFLLNAFKYGAPPHGGIAFGFDRIIALLCGTRSIRDVIAFPKTVSAASLMDDSPNKVTKEQLDELGIILKN